MILAVLDPTGVYEGILRSIWMVFLAGGAFFVLLYLWYKNRLDMDEKPKDQMLKMDENHLPEDKEKK